MITFSATQNLLLKVHSLKVWGQVHRQTASVAAMRQILDTELESIREAGTWKHERVITSPQGSFIQVTGRSDQILNFCANNYLGLSVCFHRYFCILQCNFNSHLPQLEKKYTCTYNQWFCSIKSPMQMFHVITILQSTTVNSSSSKYGDFVRIIQYDEFRVHFNIGSQWSVSSSSEAICPNLLMTN